MIICSCLISEKKLINDTFLTTQQADNCLCLGCMTSLDANGSIREEIYMSLSLAFCGPSTLELTHRGREKVAAISETIFSNAFSWNCEMKMKIQFHWTLFSMVQLTINQCWFSSWLGTDQATSHDMNQWWLVVWRINVSFSLSEINNNFVCLPSKMWVLYRPIKTFSFYNTHIILCVYIGIATS